MRLVGLDTAVQNAGGLTLPSGVRMSDIITRVLSVEEARSLPQGAVVGDTHGGLTFSDAVASLLEKRSHKGWFDVVAPDGNRWTVIQLNR